jgi:outer membrane protein OmpA-like peptidoglycan-associated protein
LNADTTLLIDKKHMKGQIDLELHQLQLETVESKNSLQSKIPVPLNIALDTLRDSNDTIVLKIPIKGDPNSPSFDPNDAITKALATGVKKGALTYLTFALQPYGAVITAAKYAGEELTKVHLKPVEFGPGLSEIDAEDKDYLGKVAGVLKERPKLAIKLCGVAVDADKAYLQQQAAAKTEKDNKSQTSKPAAPEISEIQLTELAGTRANLVKDYLVEQFGIPASHLVNCKPRIDTDNSSSQPRTDLLI